MHGIADTQKAKMVDNLKNIKQKLLKTLRRGNSPYLYFNHNTIPQADSIRYLGIHLNKRLTWKRRIAATRKHLDLSPGNCTGS